MRTLYFDCFAGASGDMILGALIDAGFDVDVLKAELIKLNLPNVDIRIERVDRSGIAATKLKVIVPDERNHRHLADIQKIIDGSQLSADVKTRSKAIFGRLGEAEALVHGIDIEKVHFHEVGAADAIVDIVGACVGFEILGIEDFRCSIINVGSGCVEMEHGVFPVPPPAVTELLKGVPIFAGEVDGEMTTPTGAAIITTVCNSYGRVPEMEIEQTGYGAGSRTYERFPNVIRVLIGETRTATVGSNSEELVLLETNIDDSTPQTMGFVMERALKLGANDCWITPIQMKKNRPGFLVSILCTLELKARMLHLLYAETTTLGVRVSAVSRDMLVREVVTVKTRFGPIDVKVARSDGRVVNIMPEYDHLRAAAIEYDVPFAVVRDAALDALKQTAAAGAK
jgi:uncharacterized protein (TIGR00299 family) protein